MLEQYATERELEYLKAIEEHGSQRKASAALGVSRTAVDNAMKRLKRRAALQGYAPDNDMVHPAPDSHIVKGTSTLYKDGVPALQWVKTDVKRDQLIQVMQETALALKEDLPKYGPVDPPNHGNSKLANLHIITDYHLGQLSWGEETGVADWDLDIAENLLYRWFASAIKQAPDAEVGILGQLGDMLHWDGLEAVTPTHGHLLDADTRYQKLVRCAIRALRSIINMMLKKYTRVHVIMATGNHDLSGAVWLREMFAEVYSNEPRVTVDTSPDVFYAYEWGKTALFFHHGHKRKPVNVAEVFAAKWRQLFGRTEHAYVHMGHMHHEHEIDTNLMTVRQHRTMAASDAHSSGLGHVSKRSADVTTYHKDYGQVARMTLTPEMVM